jgi:hypothetical protein
VRGSIDENADEFRCLKNGMATPAGLRIFSIYSTKSIIIGNSGGIIRGFDSVKEFYLASTPLEHKDTAQ